MLEWERTTSSTCVWKDRVLNAMEVHSSVTGSAPRGWGWPYSSLVPRAASTAGPRGTPNKENHKVITGPEMDGDAQLAAVGRCMFVSKHVFTVEVPNTALGGRQGVGLFALTEY